MTYPILEHDVTREALIEPSRIIKPRDMPEHCVICFFLAFFHPGVGAPLAAALLEDAIAFGCRKFMACGGCGVLAKDMAVGHLIVVSGAVRDEGVSYHYLPPSREVVADEAGVASLVKILNSSGVSYLVGKTWTTDAPYRETPNKIANRRAEGCLTVEMEKTMPEPTTNHIPAASEPAPEDILQKDQATFAASMSGDEPYALGPDSTAHAGVPRGDVTRYHWKSERVYPGTERDYWLYVPQQYNGAQPACLMVFQDGEGYLGPDVNVPIVFDNLIHTGDMPVTIGLFVSPGDKGPGSPFRGGTDNRSLEYDSLDDRYARFLIEELLPEIGKRCSIVNDPAGRAICGISSGGICAFTVAWERPDAFRKVVSHCGSFANIRGGHNYPSLIRQTETKPIRVFLQTGSKDLDIVFGNWPIANQDMAAALAYRKYDYQLVFGEGGHTLKHGGAIFPDTLRWLWRDYPQQERR